MKPIDGCPFMLSYCSAFLLLLLGGKREGEEEGGRTAGMFRPCNLISLRGEKKKGRKNRSRIYMITGYFPYRGGRRGGG